MSTHEELLRSISEPITEVSDDRVFDCPNCSGDNPHRPDDPADCPECAGSRYIVP